MLACALFVQYGLHLELEHLKEASNEIRDPELKLLRLEVPLSQHLRYWNTYFKVKIVAVSIPESYMI